MNVPLWLDQRCAGDLKEIYDILGEDVARDNLQNRIATGFLLSLSVLDEAAPAGAVRPDGPCAPAQGLHKIPPQRPGCHRLFRRRGQPRLRQCAHVLVGRGDRRPGAAAGDLPGVPAIHGGGGKCVRRRGARHRAVGGDAHRQRRRGPVHAGHWQRRSGRWRVRLEHRHFLADHDRGPQAALRPQAAHKIHLPTPCRAAGA